MENNFENLEIGIGEFAFLMQWEHSKASDYFKSVCLNERIDYKPRLKLSLKTLANQNKAATSKLVEKALDIHENYFKRYEGRYNLLNDAKCVDTGLWGSSKNAPVKVFLKQEDIQKIEENWKIKRGQFYSQQTLFGVENKLYVPRKSNRKEGEKKIAAPN